MQVSAGSEWNKTLRKQEDHYIMLASAFQIVMHGSAFSAQLVCGPTLHWAVVIFFFFFFLK